MPVEEAIRSQQATSGFLIKYADVLASKDRILFDSGKDSAVQLGLQVASAPVYTWANHVKQVVDIAQANYPLAQGLAAIHFFHQPLMFWLFDQTLFHIIGKDGERVGIDAVMISPWVEGRARTAAEIIDRTMKYIGGTSEQRRELHDEVIQRATGVQVFGFHSLRTGARVSLPFGAIEVGSRLCCPTLCTSITFGQHSAMTTDDDVTESQCADPTVRDEIDQLKRWALAGSALLKQRILIAESQRATRPEKKRLDRDGLMTSVRTVTLRETESTGQTATANLQEWSHRWIVRGHWRQQWYRQLVR